MWRGSEPVCGPEDLLLAPFGMSLSPSLQCAEMHSFLNMWWSPTFNYHEPHVFRNLFCCTAEFICNRLTKKAKSLIIPNRACYE